MQRAIAKLIRRAEDMGLADQVPQVLRDHVEHGAGNGGALAWAKAHPGDDAFRGCCWGDTQRGAAACTCWIPEFDLEQQPLIPPADGEIQPRRTMCGDCAYRPGSPEMSNPLEAEELRELPLTGTAFWCHDGVRRPVRWRHPDGRVITGNPADYQPPTDKLGRVYRADGRVGALCAGWAACSRRWDNQFWKEDAAEEARRA